jgi:hypothetical protein
MRDQGLQLIDVADWPADDFFATYPEGARDKRAFFPPDNCALPFINKSRRYLFKLSDKRYKDQFWGEIVAHRVGQMIGVSVPPAYPAIDSSRNEAAALIEWFYEDGKQASVHGGRFMQQMIPGFDMKTGKQHNFRAIRRLFGLFQKSNSLADPHWLEAWAKVFIFDALIGNTDRHQNNWGLLFDSSREQGPVDLAPWFDNGTSLGCERWEANVSGWSLARLDKYLYNGNHHMRWDKASPNRCGFFEMPKLLIELAPSLRDPMLNCIEAVDLTELSAFMNQCTAIPSYVPLSPWRAGFMLRLIERRQEILAEILL